MFMYFNYAALNQKIDLYKKAIIYKTYKSEKNNYKLNSRLIGPYYRPFNKIALIIKIGDIELW